MKYTFVIVGILLLVGSAYSAEETIQKKAVEIHPYMCSGPFAEAIVADLKDGIVASFAGSSVKQGDLDAEIAKTPEYAREQVKAYPVFVLEQHVVRSLLLAEAGEWAAKNGKSQDTDERMLIGDYLSSVVPEQTPTADEINAVYEEHKESFAGVSLDQAKNHLETYLKAEKKADAQNKFIDSIGKRHKIELSASWLESAAKMWAENPVEKARVSGKPSFIAFSTVGCCDTVSPVVQKVKTKHGDDVNAIFINIGQEQVLANIYRVKSSPMLVFFDKNGKEVMRHNGTLSAEQVQTRLSEMGVK